MMEENVVSAQGPPADDPPEMQRLIADAATCRASRQDYSVIDEALERGDVLIVVARERQARIEPPSRS